MFAKFEKKLNALKIWFKQNIHLWVRQNEQYRIVHYNRQILFLSTSSFLFSCFLLFWNGRKLGLQYGTNSPLFVDLSYTNITNASLKLFWQDFAHFEFRILEYDFIKNWQRLGYNSIKNISLKPVIVIHMWSKLYANGLFSLKLEGVLFDSPRKSQAP